MPKQFNLTRPTKSQRYDWKTIVEENSQHLPPKGKDVDYRFGGGRRLFRQGELSGPYRPED